jgi:hypothetical protein
MKSFSTFEILNIGKTKATSSILSVGCNIPHMYIHISCIPWAINSWAMWRWLF